MADTTTDEMNMKRESQEEPCCGGTCENCSCSAEQLATPDFATRIKRVDKTLPLPKYHTKGSVGFDLYSRESLVLKPKTITLVPGNVIVKIPEGYMLSIALRSSSPRRKGLSFPAGLGIIDRDYCGDEDELQIQVYNFTDEDVVVEKGERLAQAIFFKVGIAEWEEVESMGHPNRGGYGTTGTH